MNQITKKYSTLFLRNLAKVVERIVELDSSNDLDPLLDKTIIGKSGV